MKRACLFLRQLELVDHTNTYNIISRNTDCVVECIIAVKQVDFVINVGGEVFVEVDGFH